MDNLGELMKKRFTLDKDKNDRRRLLKLFQDYKIPNNEGVLVSAIQEKDKKNGGYQTISGRRLAVLLAHVPTDDLYPFYLECEKAKHFGKYFWWALKTKKCK